MICAGLSDILYPSDTLGENSCIVCVLCMPLLYVHAVTLHSTQMFTFIMLIDMSDSCHLRGRSIWRESQQQSDDIGFVKINSVGASNPASHRIVVCVERYWVFSILVIGVIVAIVTMYYVNRFKRVAVWTFP